MRLKLHHLPSVRSGLLFYPFSEAKTVFECCADIASFAPNELTVQVGVVHGPDRSPVILINPTWCGTPEEGANPAGNGGHVGGEWRWRLARQWFVSIRPRWRLWRGRVGRVGRSSLLWLSKSRRRGVGSLAWGQAAESAGESEAFVVAGLCAVLVIPLASRWKLLTVT
jgi:hypothetical protein